MAAQLRQNDPEAIIYTVNEMRELLRLESTPGDIKRIRNAKNALNGSKILPTLL